MSILIFFIILLVLVIIHELGHFSTAKYFGIRVDEFAFGFPPKIFSWKKGETEYSFNLLPIGGFVRIFGENPNEENTSGSESSRSFVNKPKWQQAIVLVAGVAANFLLAWLLFSFGFMSGMPSSVGSQPAGQTLRDVNVVLVSVAPESPAYASGLRPGDKVLGLGSNDLVMIEEGLTVEKVKSTVVNTREGESVIVAYKRGNADLAYAIVTPERDGAEPKIGISMDLIGTAELPFFAALKEGAKLTLSVIKQTTVGLLGLIADSLRGEGSLASVTGPVGLVGVVGDAYSFGFSYLLSFTALISINLGVINLFPFPALDGGRLLFVLIEKIKGSAINPKFFNIANTIGFALLIFFMLVVTYKDVTRLF